MEAAVETALSILKEKYKLTPVAPGRFGAIKVYGLMKFLVEQYTMEGIGSLSIIRMKMGLPLMTMATLVVTPFAKNLPPDVRRSDLYDGGSQGVYRILRPGGMEG